MRNGLGPFSKRGFFAALAISCGARSDAESNQRWQGTRRAKDTRFAYEISDLKSEI